MSCVRQSCTTLAIEKCDVFLHAEIVGDMEIPILVISPKCRVQQQIRGHDKGWSDP